MISFISQKMRDYVYSHHTLFKDATPGQYLNEDMTVLQRKLFTYLRNKDPVVIKKSVGFRDGHIIFVLEKNKSKERAWSRINTVKDLQGLDDDLDIDLSNDDLLETLGLTSCKMDIKLT